MNRASLTPGDWWIGRSLHLNKSYDTVEPPLSDHARGRTTGRLINSYRNKVRLACIAGVERVGDREGGGLGREGQCHSGNCKHENVIPVVATYSQASFVLT